MTNLQQALNIFTEIQETSKDVPSKLRQITQLMTSAQTVMDFVAVGVFSSILAYFPTCPHETLQLIEVLVCNRDTAIAFLESIFYDTFLPMVAEQSDPILISACIRVIIKVTRFTKVNAEVLISFITPFVTPQYLSSVDILFNVLSHKNVFPDPSVVESLVGKLLTLPNNDNALAVYYSVMEEGVDAQKCVLELAKKLSQRGVGQTYVIGIFAKLLQKHYASESLKKGDDFPFFETLISPVVTSQVGSIISESREISKIELSLTFFEILSAEREGVKAIKNTGCLKNLILLFEESPLPTSKFDRIFNIITNCAIDNELFLVLSHLHIFRYAFEILTKRLIDDRKTVLACYRVLLVFYDVEETKVVNGILERNDCESIEWLFLAALSKKYVKGIPDRMVKNVKEGQYFIMFDVLLKYISVFENMAKKESPWIFDYSHVLENEDDQQLSNDVKMVEKILFDAICKGYEVVKIAEIFVRNKIYVTEVWLSNIKNTDEFFSMVNTVFKGVPKIEFLKMFAKTSFKENISFLTLIYNELENQDLKVGVLVLEFFTDVMKSETKELVFDLGWSDSIVKHFCQITQDKSVVKKALEFIKIVATDKMISEEATQKALEYTTSFIEGENDVSELACELLSYLS
ncbi:hypothetical protein EIN_005640 [Entamoeba invadens IP1]|uniref:Uncharacterized protein n=1 Tax=Entamoeba invadens IP1 TaxID=370355 RepID=A0A0A1UCM1_ENTIV|nr:hypothetical protein EIN_005640 [Entamoeba invadens IP1]ELP93663.1 hypothetical protein EIN_005640 [Entamoeba invadens IP1]|eukprot:XP_004260434.1 hypothetical protein EIN_005640 [Entamoeba invadens IP1]